MFKSYKTGTQIFILLNNINFIFKEDLLCLIDDGSVLFLTPGVSSRKQKDAL